MNTEVRELVGSARPGRCVIVRGRRRIGKSALVEEFIEQQRVPSVFYTAEIGFGGEPLREFSDAVRISGLREAQVFGEAVPGNWAAALRQLAGVLPGDGPSIVVLDELPYLMDPDGAFESVLQRSWDRELSRKPVLLVLVGSDLSMMEALTSYGRPFHQRGMQLKVGPLNPADVAAMAGLPGPRLSTRPWSPAACRSSAPGGGTARTRGPSSPGAGQPGEPARGVRAALARRGVP